MHRNSLDSTTTNYFYISNSNKLSYVSGQPTPNYSYNENGQMIIDSTKQLHAEYDTQGLTTQMTLYGTDYFKSTYDASGLRVIKQTSGFDWAYEGDGEWTYYITDHLGIVRAVIDSLGNTKETYDYDPYGMLLRAGISGVDPAEIRYTGYELENEHDSLNVYFANARMYDPEIGRF